MPTSLGVNFWGGPETLEKQGQKFAEKKLPSKSAEKFAGNLPKIRQAKIKKNHPKSALQRVGINI